MSDNINIGTYDFQDTFTGNTFNGVLFEVLVNSYPMDLTGFKIECWIRRTGGKIGTFDKRLTTKNGSISIIDATEGTFQINPFIVKLQPKQYFYDVQITFPDGQIKTYVEGSWLVLDTITKTNRHGRRK